MEFADGRILSWFNMTDKKFSHIIIYDGVCNLCNFWGRLILKYDPNHKFLLIPFQSEDSTKQLRDAGKENASFPDSIICIINGKVYEKSAAILAIASELPFPMRLLRFLKIVPAGLREPVYDIIAKYRYTLFGKSDYCRMPGAGAKSNKHE